MLNIFIASGYTISSITYTQPLMPNFNLHEFKIRNNYGNLWRISKNSVCLQSFYFITGDA